MARNNLITIYCLGHEIGRLGYDEQRNASFFQYSEDFLRQGQYLHLFPLMIRRIPQTQVFSKQNNEAFRGLPPAIADSLPDLFGNIIFKTWIESANRRTADISVLEQLAYVGSRGMGALEYHPAKSLSSADTIDINEITHIVTRVLYQKTHTEASRLDHQSLLHIFRIGTSAGGMRPKILIAEHKTSGLIVPGDAVTGAGYDQYLVKLGIDPDASYSREMVEYTYYLAATHAGINMMPSRMIDGKHFATLRFDRHEGRKKHVLTVTGLTGLNYLDPVASSYENLFDLLVYLKCPHKDAEQLFRRMTFNLVFANHDDHLKNHSMIYSEERDTWRLAPAYDLTYSLNAQLNIKTISRALSICGKRTGITPDDLKAIAERYTIKHHKAIIAEVQNAIPYWQQAASHAKIPARIIETISKNFTLFI